MRISTVVLILASFACIAPHRIALAQTAALTPTPKQQFFDNNGLPLAGGLLYSYIAGTSAPQNTYTDVSGSVPNANPVVLDAAGRAAVWLKFGQIYKLQLQTSAGVTIWTIDQVSGGPLDMMTTDTTQTILGNKTFTGTQIFQNLVVTGTCTGCANGGGGGLPSFSGITTGANTSATMTLGTGSALANTGTAVINFGATGGSTSPVRVDTASNISGSNCGVGQVAFASDATAGKNLYYCTAMNTWTQQISSGGGAAFSALTGGTNTGAAMLVGSGASLGPSATGGTIKATSVVDSNQNAVLIANPTTSAVDQITATNGATGSPGSVSLAATGSDTDINLLLQSKGAGTLQLGSSAAYVDASGNLTVNACTGCGGGGGSTLPVVDTTSIVKNNSDTTKQMRFAVGGLSHSTTRVLTVQDSNATIAGLELAETFSGKQTFSAGIALTGGNPSIDATGLGAALNINGATGTNGNIILNPGNVTGLSSAVVNGRSNSNVQTLDLIVTEVGSATGSGISMKHGGGPTFDAAWQAGTSAAFDVVGNDASTHRFVILQNGQTLVGRTTDDGTGALFQVNGGGSGAASLATSSSTTAILAHNFGSGPAIEANSASGYGFLDASTNGSLFTNVAITGKVGNYNNLPTTGLGVAPIYFASTRTTTVGNSIGNNLTVNSGVPPAGTYRVCAFATSAGHAATGTITVAIQVYITAASSFETWNLVNAQPAGSSIYSACGNVPTDGTHYITYTLLSSTSVDWQVTAEQIN